MRPDQAIYIPWILWLVTWFAASRWANGTLGTPARGTQALYRTIEIAGFALLLAYMVPPDHDVMDPTRILPLWMLPDSVRWLFVGVAGLGFALCWWARIYLGRLWSNAITRKEGHRVVDTGPYAFVRHPIYTGIILAALATMVVRGTGTAVLGVALLTIAYWIKARLEERFLRAELGAQAYDAYARKTAMLVPFVRL
jgi:protein-S-isoprenylcysteine O-methyltransferase Ste14